MGTEPSALSASSWGCSQDTGSPGSLSECRFLGFQPRPPGLASWRKGAGVRNPSTGDCSGTSSAASPWPLLISSPAHRLPYLPDPACALPSVALRMCPGTELSLMGCLGGASSQLHGEENSSGRSRLPSLIHSIHQSVNWPPSRSHRAAF